MSGTKFPSGHVQFPAGIFTCGLFRGEDLMGRCHSLVQFSGVKANPFVNS